MMDRKGFLRLISAGGLGSLFGSSIHSNGTKNPTIKPTALKKGDTIGLISPGFILPERKQYDKIVDQIQKLGYTVKEGPNARNTNGYLAGTDKERVADLHAMFADDSVGAILPFRGGWGCNRLLPLIDFDLIQNNPKIIVGFSDITTLLLAIYAKTGLITFHGPVGKSDWTDFTVQHFRDVLHGTNDYIAEIPEGKLCDDCNSLSVITPGQVSGRLLGGNLTVLSAMMGSDYLPQWQDNILFIEDVGEAVYRIDRMLTQLKLNGVLDQISGFVLGQCNSCDPSNSYSQSLHDVLNDHIKPLGIPAFSGALIGHIENMTTLPVGLQASIDAGKGTISIGESAVL
ncbi:LD-carboxypeptidase [Fodinibius sp. Rm-B-1B1-1]|uniref:S66 peptidase family protein n=1 Tax=Fodinibius alkaliphilus TaxID=3140241 RepID=UPI00315ABCE1